MRRFFRSFLDIPATHTDPRRWNEQSQECGMTTANAMRRLLFISLLCTTLQAPLCAQSVPAPPSAPPSAPPPNKESDGVSQSLDDILGIPEAERGGSQGADEIAGAKRESAVKRTLAGQPSLSDLMQRVLEEMKISQVRLVDARDIGLGTQRAQEAALKALDALIASARQQQQQQQSSSSSSSSSKSQESKQKSENGDPSEGKKDGSESAPKPDGEKSSAESGQDGGSQAGDESDKQAPFEQGDAGAELREARIEWGRLPRRVRELILQGRRDHVSVAYEKLTREYYQRLAEEASR